MNICYLIDVAPDRMTGGGQVHLSNLVREVKRSDLAARSDLIIFGGSSSLFFIRFFWILCVIPQVLFHHFFFRHFDLIHAHSIPAMIPAKVLSLLLGIPVVVTVHGSVLPVAENSYIRIHISYLKKLVEEIVLTKIRYDAQITVSRDFLRIPNHNKNVVYIPNGVDVEKYKKVQKSTKKYKKERCVLFVGRKNDPIKGFSILERAMEIVKREVEKSKKMYKKVREGDMKEREENVRLLVADGTVSPARLLDLYHSADVLVIPSLSEGFPLTLLESWTSKVPVVATAVGEIPYLVKDGVNGFLVSPGNVHAFANGIIRALKHKNLAKIGENGYNVVKHYSWKKVATETYSLYRQILHEVPFTNH